MNMLKRGVITSLVLVSAIVLMPAVSIAEPTQGPMVDIVGDGENPWQSMDERVSVLEMSLGDLEEELADLNANIAGGFLTLQDEIDAINGRIAELEARIAEIEADLLLGAHIVNGECPDGLVVTGVVDGVVSCKSTATSHGTMTVWAFFELGRLGVPKGNVLFCDEGYVAISTIRSGFGSTTWISQDSGFDNAWTVWVTKSISLFTDNVGVGTMCLRGN